MDKTTVGNQISTMFRSIVKMLEKTLSESHIDFTLEQFGVLSILNEQENLTQQDIAVMLNKDKSGILRHIDNLEKRKLVVRVADETDRRKKILIITKKGYETITEFAKIKEKMNDTLFKGISQEQLNSLHETINIMQNNLK